MATLQRISILPGRNGPKSTDANLIALQGVQVIQDIDFETLLKLWPDQIPDFGDAIVAVVCKSEKDATVATFDKKFARSLRTVGLSSVRW